MKLQNQSSLVKGVLCIIAAALGFSLMSVCIRLAGDLPSMQKVFFRNLVAMLFSLTILLKDKYKIRLEKGSLKFLLARSIFGVVGIFLNFYAIDHLNIADATILNKMSPFFAIVFSALLLKERVSLAQGLIVVGAFVGSLFVIKPSFANADLLASIMGFGGGLTAGIAYTFVRMLSGRKVNKMFIVFFFSAFSTIVSLPFLISSYTPMSFGQLAALIGAGVCACVGQVGITSAYSYAPAKEVSIYDYSQIIFSAIFGLIFFKQMPDGWSFLGYAIIIGMAVVMFLYNKNRTAVDRPCNEKKDAGN